VLAILDRAETSLTSGEVAQQLERPLAYTTVMTVLSRLHDKGALSRVRNGRAYAYSFQRDEAARRAAQMRNLLGEGQDRARVLAQFVGELSEQDEALLQRLLRESGGT
jgi:predicted transcriptional regulator